MDNQAAKIEERFSHAIGSYRTLVKSAYQKIIFLFLNQNICCGTQKNHLNETVLIC